MKQLRFAKKKFNMMIFHFVPLKKASKNYILKV